MKEKKNASRVLGVLLVIYLAAALLLGYRAHQLSEQKAQSDFLSLSNALNYVETVLVTMEDEEQWNDGINFLGMHPWNIYQVEDQGDNQKIVKMLWALQDVWGDHPQREQIIEGLNALKIGRDSENMTFTILEGDAEAITALCQSS